jgi:hypothetical protein
MLEEQSLRAAGFDASLSVEVSFAAGARFHVRRPTVVIRAQFVNGKPIGASAALDDPEVAGLLTELREAHTGSGVTISALESDQLAEEEAKNTRWYLAAAALAACLLRRNYDLSDEQLGDLLATTAGAVWLSKVPAIARGME